MLKNIFNKDSELPFKLRGNLVIKGEENGKLVHYDEGDNVVTLYAKHANMHLLTSESFSAHGNTNTSGTIYYSGRSITPADHTATLNIDGTMISGGQYFTDNTGYWNTDFEYLTNPTNMTVSGTDPSSNFNYPFFPTKMLFGTGIEYRSWSDIPEVNRGVSSDPLSYAYVSNGSWDEATFNSLISDSKNYYSNQWNAPGNVLYQTRTVSDVSSNVLSTTPLETDYGIAGAIKDCTYNNSATEGSKIAASVGNFFAIGSYRGIGRPSFIYARRDRFFNSSSETRLSPGTIAGTESSENKVSFTVVMPDQSGGEFYPYNGYALKTAGLYCDARMVLANDAPDVGDAGTDPYTNYHSMPCGILWAKRNIATIYKTHSLKITATWTIYLP